MMSTITFVVVVPILHDTAGGDQRYLSIVPDGAGTTRYLATPVSREPSTLAHNNNNNKNKPLTTGIGEAPSALVIKSHAIASGAGAQRYAKFQAPFPYALG